MAYTQADLDNLKTAIASGVRQVLFDGKQTLFRSLDEMKQIQKEIEAEIATGPAKPKQVRFVTRKGL